MGIATPIGIVIDENALAPGRSRPRPKTGRTVVADDKVVLSTRPPRRSTSQIAIQVASQAAEKVRSSKTWLLVSACVALLVAGTIIYLLPTKPNTVAGMSLRELGSLEAIVFFSGVMSGLSGFGFSGIGAASLLILPPILKVPLFQALSSGNQFLSVGQLRDDMPKSRKDLWAGPGPCMLGGAVGVPIGIWLLSHVPAASLMVVFGTLLTAYAAYSIFKPSTFKVRGCDSPTWGAGVGFLGGVVGGFTAFPGAAVVVWTGLRGLPKAQHRAIVQPYILLSQIYSLGLIAWLHPDYLSGRFWLLLLLTLPAVVPGTLSGLAIYRRSSDLNFKRVTYLLLGLSGLSVLVNTLGPMLTRLF